MMDTKEMDNLDCPICHKPYNEYENIPRMLPDCGHTFCSLCLSQQLSKIDKEGTFLCPEDKVPYIGNKRDIMYFPKNFALLRVLDKKKKDYSIFSTYSLSKPIENKPISYENLKNMPYLDINRPSIANNNDYCKEHSKKLEIVCIDHQQKICVNCALFGNHKNHNIKSEEEVLREITIRADKILEIFQGIEDSSSEIFLQYANEESLASIYENFIKKTERISKTINEKFSQLRQYIKELEKKILNEFLEAFQLLEGKLKILKKIPFLTFQNDISAWKLQAKEKLMSLSEKTEKNQMPYDILENKEYPDKDIVKIGQLILLQAKKISTIPLNSIKSAIDTIDVKFNDISIFKSIDEGFCDRNLKLSSDLKKNSLSADDIRNLENYFVKSRNNNMQNQAIPNKSWDFSLSNDEMIKSRQSIHMINEKLEEKRTGLHDESNKKSTFSTEFQGGNSFITSLNFQELIKESNPKLDDSEFLLSGDLTDFSSKLSQMQNSSSNNNASNNTKSKPPLKHDEKQKTLQIIEEKSEKTIGSSKTLNNRTTTFMVMNNKRANSKSPFRGSNNMNTSLDKFSESDTNNNNNARNMVSPNKSVSPFLVESALDISTEKKLNTHLSQKKLGGFRLNEKFLPVLNGLRTDILEVVDFTCADLGDNGITFLAESLSGSISMKSLKLVKNKISDEGTVVLCKALTANYNLANLNMTLNMLTEKSIDIFYGLIKSNCSLKNLYLLQNNISVNKFKSKIKDFKNLGTNLFI